MRPQVSERVLAQTNVGAGTYTSAVLDTANVTTLRAVSNVSAVAGTTPAVDVFIEDSLDGGTTWNTVATLPSATAPARSVVNVTTPFAERARVRAVVSGAVVSASFAVDLYSD